MFEAWQREAAPKALLQKARWTMSPILDKKERILAAATELFSRWGYNKTSLDEVAARARIAKATIYYYFPGKDQLFIAAFSAKAEELFAKLDAEIGSAQSFEDKLSCFLRLPMTYIFENMPILIEAMHQIPADFLENMEVHRNDYHNRMNALLAGIMDYGQSIGIINEWMDSQRFSELINDWFMLGDSWIDLQEKDKIIRRIERDHELIVQLLLHGIIKPGRENSARNKSDGA